MPLDVKLVGGASEQYPLEAFKEDIPKVDNTDYNITPEELPDDFLKKLPKALRERIVNAPEKGSEKRSQNDFHVARRLLQESFTPGQILTVFLTETWSISSKTSEKGVGYACRTIVSALKEETESKPESLAALAESLHWNEGKRRKEIDPDSAFTRPCIDWLKAHDMRFLRDKQSSDGFIFWEGRVIGADKDSRELKDLIYEMVRVTEASWDSRKLREAIAHEARVFGKDVVLHTWVTFDALACKGYILPDPRTGGVVVIEPDKLRWDSNGVDGFLLRPSMLSQALKLNFDVDKKEGVKKYVELMARQFACSPMTKRLLACYTICIILRDFASSDLIPILHLTGSSGGGKSWALKLITTFLYGRPLLLRATQASSYAISTSDPLLALDDYENLDSEWQGRLLTGATGLVRTKMSSTTHNQAVLQEGTVTFALTSINPLPTETLRRRAAVVEMDSHKYALPDFNATTAISNLEAARNEIWSALLRLIAEDILPVMRTGSSKVNIDAVQKLIKVTENRSQATYLTLMWLVGQAIDTYYTGFLPGDLEETCGEWIDILNLQSHDEFIDRDALILAVDLTMEELKKVGGDWTLLRGVEVKPIVEAGKLLGFQGTGAELHATFGSVIRNHGLKYDMTSANSVGRRFQLSDGLLKRAGWNATPVKFGPRRGWSVVHTDEAM